MSGLVTVLIIGLLAAGGVFFWMNRCSIIPSICGGTGDQRTPMNLNDMVQGLSQQAINTATATPTGPIQKVAQPVYNIDTKGTNSGLSDAALKMAGAKYARAGLAQITTNGYKGSFF